MSAMTEYFVKMIEAGPSPERIVAAERNKRARSSGDDGDQDESSAESERIRIAGKLRQMFSGDFLDAVLKHCGLAADGEPQNISPSLVIGNQYRSSDVERYCKSLGKEVDEIMTGARSSIGLAHSESAQNYDAIVISCALFGVKSIISERDRCVKAAEDSLGYCDSTALCCNCSREIAEKIRKG